MTTAARAEPAHADSDGDQHHAHRCPAKQPLPDRQRLAEIRARIAKWDRHEARKESERERPPAPDRVPTPDMDEGDSPEYCQVTGWVSEEDLAIEEVIHPNRRSREVRNDRYALSVSHYCYL